MSRKDLGKDASGSAGVVLVTTSFPTSGNGSEAAGAFVFDLAQEIARHEPVRVVAPGSVASVELMSTDLIVHRFLAPVQPLSTLKPWKPADCLRIWLVTREGQRATLRALDSSSARLIVALWALPCGRWAQKASKITGVPYSVWTLGSDIWSLGRMPIVRRILRQVLSGASSVYSDGIELARETQTISRRNVTFLPSTRSLSGARAEPPRSKSPYRFIFIGRWHRNKGIDLLMRALGRLSSLDWQGIESVTVYGGGELSALVHDQGRRLVASGRPVFVRGFIDKAGAEAALSNADWLVIPSRIESIPVVYSDALKSAVPVLATPVGDLPSLLARQKTGLLAGDVSELAIAGLIRAAIQHSARSFDEPLREAARLFDIASVARTLTDRGAVDRQIHG